MKSVILFICLFFSYFTLATTVPIEEVVFTDETIENLPPVDEMVGVAVKAPGHSGEADSDIVNKNTKEVEAEVQLAHGGRCRRHHGGHGCGRDRGRYHRGLRHRRGHHHRWRRHRGHRRSPSPPVIVVQPPIVVIPQPIQVNNICRNGIAYCLTPAVLPVGTYCECHSYSFFIFGGQISSY